MCPSFFRSWWIASLLLLCTFFSLQAQTTATWDGQWDGSIQLPGTQLDLSISLKQEGSTWKGSMDIPAQGIKGMELAELRIESDSIAFKLPQVPGNASFKGQRKGGDIRGVFRQVGQGFDLNLRKNDEIARALLAQKVARIQHLIDSFRVAAQVPGLGVGMTYKGEVLVEKGFGYRNYENKEPVGAGTLFAIGSSSKAFTVMGLALLADEGKLAWDKPVRDYLPDFQLYDEYATQKMTAIDLLCHRSGLPRHDLLWYATPFTRTELYSKLRYLEPSYGFREKWQYQNLMFMTAGYLTEKLSGISWEDFMASRIFKPLGMNTANTSISAMEKSTDFAYGYGLREDSIYRLPFHALDAVGPAGSINASVKDMMPWLRLHLNQGKHEGQAFVDAAALQRMHSPQMVMEMPLISLPAMQHPSYGLGWFIYDYDGEYVVEHGGNIDGFSALVYTLPDSDLGIVLLSNLNGNSLNYVLAYTITDILLDRTPTDWYGLVYNKTEESSDEEKTEPTERRTPGTRPQHPLADYLGKYEHPAYGRLEVKPQGDSLLLEYYDFKLPLTHWHFETFSGHDPDLDITLQLHFLTDKNGLVHAVSAPLESSLPDMVFSRLPSDQLRDPDFLATLAGSYKLAGGPQITLSFNGHELTAKVAGQPEFSLVPYQKLEFKFKGLEGYSIEFILADEKPVALMVHQPNGSFRAEKE